MAEPKFPDKAALIVTGQFSPFAQFRLPVTVGIVSCRSMSWEGAEEENRVQVAVDMMEIAVCDMIPVNYLIFIPEYRKI
ncbi:hypothetical protein STEG23_000282 [Scotinomys teguina]